MKLRYVIYSPEFGVYLGLLDVGGEKCEISWSKTNPSSYDSAPTFLPGECVRDDEEEGSLATMLEIIYTSLGDILLKPIEVWPDLPFNRASIDACANAGLPRWIPNNK